MSMITQNPFLKRPGVRSVLQHFYIVVRFNQYNIAAYYVFVDRICNASDISRHRYFTIIYIKSISYRIHCIVRDRIVADIDIPHCKIFLIYHSDVFFFERSNFFPHGLPCFLTGVNRHIEFSRKNTSAFNMVGVFMCN